MIVCPKCMVHDSIQKVSSIYDQGVSQGFVNGFAQDFTNVIGFYKQQTLLSKKLAPPKNPIKRPIWFAFIGFKAIFSYIFVLIIAFVIFIISNYLTRNWTLSSILFWIFFIIPSFNIRKKAISDRRGDKVKVPIYHEACNYWESLYYCHCCDIVFDPESINNYVDSNHIADLIYSKTGHDYF